MQASRTRRIASANELQIQFAKSAEAADVFLMSAVKETTMIRNPVTADVLIPSDQCKYCVPLQVAYRRAALSSDSCSGSVCLSTQDSHLLPVTRYVLNAQLLQFLIPKLVETAGSFGLMA